MNNKDVCDLMDRRMCIRFSYPDKSTIVVVTTLNENILKENNCNKVDHFIDLLSMRVIPDYLFREADVFVHEYNELHIYDNMRKIDILLNKGVKESWEKI